MLSNSPAAPYLYDLSPGFLFSPDEPLSLLLILLAFGPIRLPKSVSILTSTP